ncbi:MAG TPA: protein-glutamate O-methyltransferase CheR [Allosphingosinicella sp.]|uniref:CheR family methyltransferase n=1 Tax=Allosphingosinicella sp. TaxID=2823234 RepID=UPI002ED867DD
MNDVSSRILASLLENRTGQQLTMSRRWRIETALKSLMRERDLATLDQLIALLVTGREAALADQVVEALLNNETYFFRDRTPFDTLLGEPLKRLEAARAQEKRISIWCAGCSTGQEVYSIAMSFAEQAARWADWKIDIIGTDVSLSAIERARRGLYSQFEVQRGLPVLQMIRWFEEREGQQWQISDQLRQSVRFQVHSLMDKPPQAAPFDIILCRNVLLYFSNAARRQVFGRLAEAARHDAVLMLGAGETVIGQTDEFVSDPAQRGLYIKREALAVRARSAA